MMWDVLNPRRVLLIIDGLSQMMYQLAQQVGAVEGARLTHLLEHANGYVAAQPIHQRRWDTRTGHGATTTSGCSAGNPQAAQHHCYLQWANSGLAGKDAYQQPSAWLSQLDSSDH